MPLTNCYRILGMEIGANEATVNQANRDSARASHPDRHEGDATLNRRAGQRFRAIQQA